MTVVLIVIVAGFFGLAIFLKYYLDSRQLDLYKTNEDQRTKNKEEIDAGVEQMLNGSQEKIELIVKQLQEQLAESKKEVRSLQKQNSAIRETLMSSNETSEKLLVSTEGLKKLLSNNSLRGDWGEKIAEDLLLGAGFVQGVNFEKQTSSKQGRPDYTIKLPDGTKLNIDAKFPLNNLIDYQQAETDGAKAEALRLFERAVKTKIKDLVGRDYIDPEAQTVDFVVLFIPNEMVFSFIYEKFPQIVTEAIDKKVIMTGPFGFTAMLRLVLQAYKNFGYEQNLHEILGLIEKFQSEYEKFGGSMEKIGRQIESAQRAFQDAEGTRHRQLTRVVEKISDHTDQTQLPSSTEE